MNSSLLQAHIPAPVYTQLPDVMTRFQINDTLRLAHFISQCDYESETFTALREDLNYSATALLAVFPTHFDAATAASYARQPEKIANHVYANRMGNGDESSGDGWNFRGRGFIQLTGKGNYQSFGHFIGADLVANPDLVATDYPLASAAFFFHNNNLFAVCDQGSTEATVTAVTRIINGGTNGLQGRLSRFNFYYGLLTDAPATPADPTPGS